MSYFILIKDNQILHATESNTLNEDIIDYEVDKALYNDFCENPKKYLWDGENVVLNENYETELAQEHKKELINNIYQIKADKAYGGVIINDALIFETNQTSITNTVASLALMGDTATANWKFYTVAGEPYVQQVSKLQLAGIAQFGQTMINETFAVEGQANTTLSMVTVEQLNDEEWRSTFISSVQTEMDKVNNKLAVDFKTTDITA